MKQTFEAGKRTMLLASAGHVFHNGFSWDVTDGLNLLYDLPDSAFIVCVDLNGLISERRINGNLRGGAAHQSPVPSPKL